MSDEENRKIFNGVKESEVGRVAKVVAQRQIESGILQGYLAFDYNKAVGWCNCNDKANFPVLSSTGDSFYFPVAGKEKAVVCFEIAPEWRGAVSLPLYCSRRSTMRKMTDMRLLMDSRKSGKNDMSGIPAAR